MRSERQTPGLTAAGTGRHPRPTLVTGAAGQLGREFCRQLGAAAVPADLDTLDLTDAPAVAAFVRELRPAAVINCAAYTRVDQAETQPGLCAAINAQAVHTLARLCTELDSLLVQISTDYVFGADATRTVPYRETDPPGPVSVYGRSKLDGERYAATCPRHLIVRTCGLYGVAPQPHNFVETMLQLGRQRRPLQVVHDQQCTPSYVVHVAQAVLFLLGQGCAGTYHVVNGGQTTWYEFACEVFRQAALDVTVAPTTSEGYGAPALRPAYSVLDTGKYQAAGGPPLPAWRAALAQYLRDREAFPI